jgi:ABC-type amino acid transport substrate-binding protein
LHRPDQAPHDAGMIWALIGAFVAIAIGITVVRPRMGRLFRGDFQGVKTEAIVGPIVTLAVFLTAFVVVQALGSFQRTNQAASQEAAAVELMFENAGLLPDQQGAPLQASAICYARSVANLEFPALADGSKSAEVDWWAAEFTQQIPPILDGPGSVVGQVVSLNRQQTEARASRIFEAQPQLPTLTVVLMVVAVLGVMLALSSLAVPDMRRRVLVLLVGLLATLLGGTLLLVEQLEEPFSGAIRVRPTAIENAAARMEAIYPAGFPFPCDESGRPVPVVAADVPAGSVAPGRQELVEFSVPYFDSDLAVVARVGATPPEGGLAGLRGLRIGVQSGSNAQEYLANNRPPGSTVAGYRTSDDLLAALRSGAIDVIVKPLPAARYDATQDAGLVVAGTLGLDQKFAIAVAPGTDGVLLGEINAAIEAARDDGTLDALNQRYFPSTPS